MEKKLFKLLTLILAFSFCVIRVNASETVKLKECEYSDAYKRWLKLSDKEKENSIMPVMCKETYMLGNYMLGNGTTTIPEKYDLRDSNLINGVKNQYDTNACWTFSSLSSIESNLLVKGLGKYDFSEGHMDLATSNNLYNPNRVTFNRDADTGGNPVFTQAYLLNQWGPINENDFNFLSYYKVINNMASITANDIESKKSIVDINETVMINNDQGVCSDNTITEIKNYILKNGAMNASLHMSGMFADGYTTDNGVLKGEFINGPYYYYDGSSYKSSNVTVGANQISDHAVTIIGWDDSIDPSNFSSKHQPSRKGAWIIQNSYGEEAELTDGTVFEMGEDGYHYISYDDINICGYLGGYYDVDLEVPENAYYYDDLGYFGAAVVSNVDDIYLGSVFTKQSEKDEIIDKISFAASESGLDYKVYFANNGSLNSYEEVASGTTDHIGYEVVKLNKELKISSNKYSVIVSFSGVKDKTIPVSAKLDEETLSNLEITEGVTFMSIDGVDWADTAEQDFNTHIRVYTNNLKTESKPDELPGDDEVKDDGNVELEKNEDTVIEDDKNNQTGVKDEVVESPKTGIEDYIVFIIGGLLIAVGIYYFLSKKNIIKKI